MIKIDMEVLLCPGKIFFFYFEKSFFFYTTSRSPTKAPPIVPPILPIIVTAPTAKVDMVADKCPFR